MPPSNRRSFTEIPLPAIEGFLEVTIGSLYAGMTATDASSRALETIQEHEEWVLRNQNRRKTPDQQRIEIAHRHLGQLVALNALLELPIPNKVGF